MLRLLNRRTNTSILLMILLGSLNAWADPVDDFYPKFYKELSKVDSKITELSTFSDAIAISGRSNSGFPDLEHDLGEIKERYNTIKSDLLPKLELANSTSEKYKLAASQEANIRGLLDQVHTLRRKIEQFEKNGKSPWVEELVKVASSFQQILEGKLSVDHCRSAIAQDKSTGRNFLRVAAYAIRDEKDPRLGILTNAFANFSEADRKKLLDATDSRDRTALIIAAEAGNPFMIHWLLNAGANPFIQSRTIDYYEEEVGDHNTYSAGDFLVNHLNGQNGDKPRKYQTQLLQALVDIVARAPSAGEHLSSQLLYSINKPKDFWLLATYIQLLKDKNSLSRPVLTSISNFLERANRYGGATYDKGKIKILSSAFPEGWHPRVQTPPQDQKEEARQTTPPAANEDNYVKAYRVLGLNRNTITPALLKRAYLKLVVSSHPDKGGDRAQFEDIKNAYDLLAPLYPVTR